MNAAEAGLAAPFPAAQWPIDRWCDLGLPVVAAVCALSISGFWTGLALTAVVGTLVPGLVTAGFLWRVRFQQATLQRLAQFTHQDHPELDPARHLGMVCGDALVGGLGAAAWYAVFRGLWHI